MGRPSDYDPFIASFICERISNGESLNKICGEQDMPHISTAFRWIAKHEEFRDKYARAREAQMDAMAEEIVAIADDTSLDVEFDDKGNPRPNNEFMQRSRLRVETRKWLMGKLAPKKYGDRTTLAGDKDAPLGVQLVHSVPRPVRES